MCEIWYFRWYKQIFNYQRRGVSFVLDHWGSWNVGRQHEMLHTLSLSLSLSFNSFYDFDEKTFQWNYFSFNIQCSLSFHLTVIFNYFFLFVSQKCSLCNSRKLKVLKKKPLKISNQGPVRYDQNSRFVLFC